MADIAASLVYNSLKKGTYRLTIYLLKESAYKQQRINYRKCQVELVICNCQVSLCRIKL